MNDEFYKEFCDPNDESLNYFMRVEHLGRYLFAKDYLKSDDQVLDIACCNGYGTRILAENCKQIYGLDKRKEYIDYAECNNNYKNIIYMNEDIDSYSLKNKFDLIVCYETIEHVKYPEKLLEKLADSSNENTTILLSFPNANYEKIENGKNLDIYHLHTFKKENMDKMISKYFSIIKVLGQSETNIIVNDGEEYLGKYDLYDDALTIGKPNMKNIDKSYSYIYILKLK